MNNRIVSYDEQGTKPSQSDPLIGALTTTDNAEIPKSKLHIDKHTHLVLVNPDRSSEHAITKFIPSPYHGTWRLKLYLERTYDLSTAVVDYNVNDKDQVINDLSYLQPKVIGFAFFYDTLEQDLENLWTIRQTCPNSLIIAGGIEATARSAEYIRKLPIDGLLRGEGEIGLASMMNIVKRHDGNISNDALIDECKEFPGWLFKYSNGSIIDTGPAHIFSPDEYKNVFDSYVIEPKLYEPYWNFIADNYDEEFLDAIDASPKLIRLITSNYCPYGCAFCVSTNFLKMASEQRSVKVVGANAQSLFDKCEIILRTEPEVFIYFDDENFLAMPQRAAQFCKLVISRGLKGKFGCRATAQLITKEICALMAEAGFVVIAFGAESWDPVVLKDFNKRLENDRADIAIANIQSSGIKCSFNVILFAPTVTKDGLLRTCDKVVEYIAKDCNVGITTYISPYPGTRYYDDKSYITVGDNLIVPGTGEELRHPQVVLPNDETMRIVAEQAIKRGVEILETWRRETSWRFKLLPREVSCLALVSAVYKELSAEGSNDRDETIKRAVQRILSNQRRNTVRTASKKSRPLENELDVSFTVENPY